MTLKKTFTERETTVIRLLSRGMSNKQIALSLGISVRTVESHLSKVYAKLGVASRAEAIVSLAETHTWESTVDQGQHRAQDGTAFQRTRRIPMRTAIYAGLFALALLLAVALLTTKLPAPAPTLVPTPSPSPGTTLNPAMPAVTVAFPNATSSAEFHLPPLSYTSPTGFTITLADVAYGPDCLRIQALASGLPPATGVDTQDPPTSVFSELNLIDPATSGPLLATLVGGGGGGGQAPDGSPLLNQEAVYAFTPNLPLDGLVLLVVELVPDASLGFEAPLTFNLQATRSTTDNCGLQGSIGP